MLQRCCLGYSLTSLEHESSAEPATCPDLDSQNTSLSIRQFRQETLRVYIQESGAICVIAAGKHTDNN